MENINRITKKFFEKDEKRNIDFPALHFQYKSYTHFLESIANTLNINEKITIQNEKKYYRHKVDNVHLFYPDKLDRDYISGGNQYEISIGYDISIYKGLLKEDPEEKLILSQTYDQNIYVQIPCMVGYESSFPKNNKSTKVTGQYGCYFIGKRGVSKVINNQFYKDIIYPGFKVTKNSKLIYQFKVVVGDFIKDPFYSFNHVIYKFEFDSMKNIIYININYIKQMNVFDFILSILGDENKFDFVKRMILKNSNKNMILILNLLFAQYESSEKNIKEININNFFPQYKSYCPDIYKVYSIIQYIKMFIYAYITCDQKTDLSKFPLGSYPDKDDIIRYRVKTSGYFFDDVLKRAKYEYVNNVRKYLENNINTNIAALPILTVSGAYNNLTLPSKDNSPFKYHNFSSWIMPLYYARAVSHRNPGITKDFITRQIHPSHSGFFDLNDIPNSGKIVGLTYSLVSTAYISEHNKNKLNNFREKIIKYFEKDNIIDVENNIPVVLEDEIISFVKPTEINNIIIDLKKKKIENYFSINDFSVYFFGDCISSLQIHFTNGRICKPLFIVTDGILEIDKHMPIDLDLTFSDIIEKYPIIEYVDVAQFRFNNICTSINQFRNLSLEQRKSINYCDFDENYRFGFVSSYLFYLNCNAGIRNIFAVHQEKSKISILRKDLRNTIESGKFICYPQDNALTNDIINNDMLENNRNVQYVRVLIGSLACENQEDSIIINSDFKYSAGFDILQTKKEDVKTEQQFFTTIIKDENIPESYSKLSKNGYVISNRVLEYGDSFCKNIVENSLINEESYKWNMIDRSSKYKEKYPSRIDRINFKTNVGDVELKILLMNLIGINEGDKFTNKNAQKGTISFIKPSEQLPYNKYGERPDIITNSISVLSRKTISLLHTSLLTMAFAYKPYDENGNLRKINTPIFNTSPLENNLKFLEECVEEYFGKHLKYEELLDEVMYNPVTHEPYKEKMFFTYLDFSRLKQIAKEKIMVVSRTQKSKQSGQAREGRSKGGGIRFGEMERGCAMAYGASNFIKDTFNDREEDSGEKYICENCGDFAKIENNKNYVGYYCERCYNQGLDTSIHQIEMKKASVVKKEILNIRGIKNKIVFDYSKNNLFYKPMNEIIPEEILNNNAL